MFNPENLIRKGLPKGYFKDVLVRGLLGGITYLMVLIAVLLFAKILIDGAPAILTSRFPFIDIEFLTAKNETLHVFDDAKGVRHQLPASKYNQYLEAHPGGQIYNEQTFSYSGGGIAGPFVKHRDVFIQRCDKGLRVLPVLFRPSPSRQIVPPRPAGCFGVGGDHADAGLDQVRPERSPGPLVQQTKFDRSPAATAPHRRRF